MKKIYTLLLLFTITLFYSIPTQAYTLDGNDIPLVQTKNLFDINRPITDYSRTLTNTTGTITIDLNANSITTTTNAVTSGWVVRYQLQPNTQYFISGTVSGSAALRAINSSFTAFLDNGFGLITTDSTGITDIYFRHTVDGSATFTNIQLERGSTSTSYTPYGFLTLNDIYEEGNLIVNGTFDNNINNWFTLSGRTLSYPDNSIRATRVSDTPYIAQFRSTNFGNNNNNFYIRFNSKSNISGTLAVALGNGEIDDVNVVYNNQTVNIDNLFKNYSLLSNITTATLDINVIRII